MGVDDGTTCTGRNLPCVGYICLGEYKYDYRPAPIATPCRFARPPTLGPRRATFGHLPVSPAKWQIFAARVMETASRIGRPCPSQLALYMRLSSPRRWIQSACMRSIAVLDWAPVGPAPTPPHH